MMGPSGSKAVEVSTTPSPATGLSGTTVKAAVGGRLRTVMFCGCVETGGTPSSSAQIVTA
jgi:hypothetical protein